MSFTHIYGHQSQINSFRSYVRAGRTAHGYLLMGPEGIGKKLFALTAAKTVNCEHAPDDVCDTCASCIKIDKGQHPDIHVITAGTDDIKIEEIRTIQRQMQLRAYEGRVKVCIMDNAHQMTAEAAHALLKILEEPPSNSLFFLITSKPASLFKTVLSRCQPMKFYPLDKDEAQHLLQKQYGLAHDKAHFLAWYAEGRLGAALGLKDKDIVMQKNRVIDYFFYNAKAAPGLKGKAGAHLCAVPSLMQRDELRECLNIALGWLRDLRMGVCGLPQELFINIDRKEDINRCSQNMAVEKIDRMIQQLSDAQLYIEQNVNVKLLLGYLRAAFQ